MGIDGRKRVLKERTHAWEGDGACRNERLKNAGIPYEGENTHKQNPPKIPGQSREMFVYVCVCFFCCLSAPTSGLSMRVSKKYL